MSLEAVWEALGLLRADFEKLKRELGMAAILNPDEARYWGERMQAFEGLLTELRTTPGLPVNVQASVREVMNVQAPACREDDHMRRPA